MHSCEPTDVFQVDLGVSTISFTEEREILSLLNLIISFISNITHSIKGRMRQRAAEGTCEPLIAF